MSILTSRTELLTVSDLDWIHIVDVSDTTDSPQGTSKKIRKSNLFAAIGGGAWGEITGVLSDQTDLQSALNGKENAFSKNTGFNKNFGTTAGTVSEGNHTHTFSSLTSKPTTIGGYGITDSYTKTEADGKYLLNTTDTLSGNLTLDSGSLYINNTGGTRSRIRYSGNNLFGIRDEDAGVDRVKIDASGLLYINDGLAWHSLNDGSGSGLDADLLDGVEGNLHMKRYYGLSQIGVTKGTETMDSIFAALPVNSEIIYSVGDNSFNTGIYAETRGVVRITKSDGYGYAVFQVRDRDEYYQGRYNSAGAWQSWKELAKMNEENTGNFITTGTGVFGNTVTASNPTAFRGVGNSTGSTNIVTVTFYESNNTVRQGYLGFAASGNSDFYVTNEVSNKILRLKSDGVIDYNGNANFTGTVTASAFYESSDRTLKHKIKSISPTFKSFEFKNIEGLRYGVIAQEIEQTKPELVQTNA
ncbi:MAG: tail fiber domain-containing protein [Arenibacter algicola]|nr:tail fiber domain-containing protein [Arenibacter algicola]